MNRLSDEKEKKLTNSKIIWLSTVKSDHSPHLIPIWYVLFDSHIWCCTSKNSVKARNIVSNSSVAISLEDGKNPVIGEGHAQLITEYPAEVVLRFENKYEWNINTDTTYDILIKIEINKWLMTR